MSAMGAVNLVRKAPRLVLVLLSSLIAAFLLPQKLGFLPRYTIQSCTVIQSSQLEHGAYNPFVSPHIAIAIGLNLSVSRHIGNVSSRNPFVMSHNAVAIGHIGNVSSRNRIVMGHIAFV
jgi:hypothetical protein